MSNEYYSMGLGLGALNEARAWVVTVVNAAGEVVYMNPKGLDNIKRDTYRNLHLRDFLEPEVVAETRREIMYLLNTKRSVQDVRTVPGYGVVYTEASPLPHGLVMYFSISIDEIVGRIPKQ